jgi:hypothetical protein
MAKTNIIFNDKKYYIDETSLSTATAELKSHLSTVMNGSGAVINLGGISYNVDSTKLTAAKNDFVSHLGTISGNGSKVVVGGVEYGIDSAKVSSALGDLETVLGGLHSEEGGSSEGGDSGYYIEDNEAGGQTFNITDVNAILSNLNNEFGGQTATVN